MSWRARVIDWYFPVVMALASGVLTLGLGFVFFCTVGGAFPASFQEVWVRWDSQHYLTISASGYSSAEGSRFLICFFPLYPAVISMAKVIVPNGLAAGLLMSNLSFAAGLIFLLKLVELDFGREMGELAVVFCVFFPTAYFFHLVYAESLFFALSVGALYTARKELWWIAGVLAFFACLTRLPGAALCPALILEYLTHKRFHWRDIRWNIAACLLPLAAMGCYLFLNYHVLGDPLAFLTYFRTVFVREFAWPNRGFLGDYGALFDGAAASRFHVAGEQVLCFGFSLVVLIWGAIRLRPSYTVFAALLWALTFFNSFWISVPRYTMMIPAIYFFLAWLVDRRPALRYSLLFSSALLYALGLLQFSLGRWAH